MINPQHGISFSTHFYSLSFSKGSFIIKLILIRNYFQFEFVWNDFNASDGSGLSSGSNFNIYVIRFFEFSEIKNPSGKFKAYFQSIIFSLKFFIFPFS